MAEYEIEWHYQTEIDGCYKISQAERDIENTSMGRRCDGFSMFCVSEIDGKKEVEKDKDKEKEKQLMRLKGSER